MRGLRAPELASRLTGNHGGAEGSGASHGLHVDDCVLAERDQTAAASVLDAGLPAHSRVRFRLLRLLRLGQSSRSGSSAQEQIRSEGTQGHK